VKPKISIVSLGVRDLDRALAFYRDGLGFPTHNYAPGDDYILLALEGTWLALHPRGQALRDRPAGGASFSSVGLSHNAPSKAAVDAVYDLALAAGATALRRPHDAHWGGYEGAFADPDGHVWDIAWNPFTDLT
jgi:catechol 2,3-dioxygenase-like lactoylglutathione lyase family enzyme